MIRGHGAEGCPICDGSGYVWADLQIGLIRDVNFPSIPCRCNKYWDDLDFARKIWLDRDGKVSGGQVLKGLQ